MTYDVYIAYDMYKCTCMIVIYRSVAGRLKTGNTPNVDSSMTTTRWPKTENHDTKHAAPVDPNSTSNIPVLDIGVLMHLSCVLLAVIQDIRLIC